MKEKQKFPIMAYLDMNSIYRKVITSLGENKVASFVIFEDQPFDVAHFNLPNGNDLIYLNNCENIEDKIINEITRGKASDIAPDFAIHSLDNEEVGLIYTMTILISEMLDIPCPQIEFRDNYEDYGSSIGERNFVCLRGYSGDEFLAMFCPLAHEIRHLWQYKNRPEYYEEKVSYKESIERYFNSPSEIDAEAFSHKLEYAVFGESCLDSEDYAMGNVKVKDKIRKHMKSIELDERTVYILKNLLGFANFA